MKHKFNRHIDDSPFCWRRW